MVTEEEEAKQYMDVFIAKYTMAIEQNKSSFYFFGEEVLVTYAKYAIEKYKNKERK